MARPQVVGQPASRQQFQSGFDAVTDLLAPTLGPLSGVVAHMGFSQKVPELLDDSATTLRRLLSLGTPQLDVGAMLVRSMVWRVGQRVGDGGATTAVLARALYNDASRIVAAGANPMRLARGAERAVRVVTEQLRSQARPVQSENDLAAVALTVTKDPALSAMLGELSYLLGADAHVLIEKYVAPYLQRRYYPGARYSAQIGSMYLYTDPSKKQAMLTDCLIAVVASHMNDAESAVTLLEAALHAGATKLAILGRGFNDAAMGVLVSNNRAKKRKLSVVAVKLKAVGDEFQGILDDLSILTGATVLGRDFSPPPAKAKPEHLGQIGRVEVSADSVQVVPVRQHSPAAQARAEELRSQLAGMAMDDDGRPVLVRRLSALTGGMGVLMVGADTRNQRELRESSAERTLKVLSGAQQHGVIPGGGAAFLHSIPLLDELAAQAADGDERWGVQVVQRGLAVPMRQILLNAQIEAPGPIMDRVRRAGPHATYDAVRGQVVEDAYAAGVLDGVDVATTVLQTAVSGAMMALSTDTIVYHRKPDQSMQP